MLAQPPSSSPRPATSADLIMNEASRLEKMGDLHGASARYEHARMADVQRDAVPGRGDARFLHGNKPIVGPRQSWDQSLKSDTAGVGDHATFQGGQQRGKRLPDPVLEGVSDQRRQRRGRGQREAAMAAGQWRAEQHDAAYARIRI